jgi:hypothetical protein
VPRAELAGGTPAQDIARWLDKPDVPKRSVYIAVVKGRPEYPEIRGKDGVHCYPRECTVVAGDYYIRLQGRDSGLSDAEVQQIANGLKLADLADNNTWLPARA